MTIGWHFDNTYSKLSNNFKEEIKPTPVDNPELVILNKELANNLNLDFSKIDKKKLSEIFSGNSLPEGTKSIAQAYAGHQFGHFTMLGDGRAVLLGEHLVNKKKRFDIQFKGSGKTSFSRGGDGRAVLGPMLREYIISEAIHNLKIPTTRSLAVVKTGENVIREKNLEGAVLTRIASSHIRIGTFQYACISKDKNDLKALFDYTIERHYPHIRNFKFPAIELLNIVTEKQIDLIVDWMRVGFIHGVMNTDNIAISGETIDYGPCAFMDTYDPRTVFSSIDYYGRYAFSNQPSIIKWNLEKFAEALIPLIDTDSNKSIEMAKEVLKDFDTKFKKGWFKMMRKKLGLKGEESKDENLIAELLSWMHQNKADYTNTFCHLMDDLIQKNKFFENEEFNYWKQQWKNRSNLYGNSPEKSLQTMYEGNPLVIPRNHLVEEALNAATENNDLTKVKELLKILKDPYKNKSNIDHYQSTPIPGKERYKTYCGT